MATTSSALVVSGTVSGSNGPSAVRPSPSAYESLLVHHTAALPYIDREIDDPKWRARVDAEVAAEARAGISARARIDERIEQVLGPAYDWHRPATSLTQETRDELDKLVQGKALERNPLFDASKFSIPDPENGSKATPEEWKEALDNARIQLGAQLVRSENVSLLKTYGVNAWRLHAFNVEADAKRAEAALEQVEQETNALNRVRRDAQLSASDVRPSTKHQLDQASSKWSTLVSNTLQISVANVAAEREIEELRAKRRRLAQQLPS